jgi:C4-dicarboxylate-specific signal transduction histidine kinase
MLSELSAARERESSDQFELARVSRLTTMGAMTASIAHEINQPLAAIAANANAGLRWLSRSTPDIEEVHAALKRINNDAHRASEVIQSVRSIFKKAPQQGAAVDVNDVVLEVLALVHGELINYRILVKSDLPRQLPQVRADRVQLQQVILNLITNAVEAMSSVQDRSRVLSVASRTQDPGSVLITVQDTGPGIDPDRRDRIFDAFFSTKASGMGMGLFICRSIIESHGGRLWATAAEPHGAIFHLLLPIGDSGAPDVAAETERTTRPFRGA